MPKAVPSPATLVHVRRTYIDGRHGQLHLTTAHPSGGGFGERTPLVCLHPAASSGRWFSALLPELARDRSVYVPDLPAHGQSDPATGAKLGITGITSGIGDFITGMRLGQIDLLGHELGATIALELAAQRPQQIRRVVLVAIPESAKSAGEQFASLSQQALFIQPADAAALRNQSTLPQHTATTLAKPSVELYGSGAQDLARVLRAFLDR